MYFGVQLCFLALEFLFFVLALFLQLLQHFGVISLFLGNLLLMLFVELLDFGRVLLTQLFDGLVMRLFQ